MQTSQARRLSPLSSSSLSEPSTPELTPEKPEVQINNYWNSPSSVLTPVFNLFSTMDEEEKEDVTTRSSSTSADEDLPSADTMITSLSATSEFDPLLFIAQLPTHAYVKHNVPNNRPLPSLSHTATKPCLVLDLDETLVHCTNSSSSIPNDSSHDVAFTIQLNNTTCHIFVKKRPHLDRFLAYVSERFEVVVFTASQRVYAERLLDILDPTGKLIHHRLFRESCLTVGGNLMKDLSNLNRDLAKTVIVDNCPHAFGYQLDNGIPILSWYDDQADVELLKLATLLDDLYHVEDVRVKLRETFGLRKLVDQVKQRMYL